MKLTYENKIAIYNAWKYQNQSPERLARQYRVDCTVINYMVHLADRYGIAVLKKGKNRYYSPEFKKEAIDRVLLGYESRIHVALDLKLPSVGILKNWIRDYKANGYNVVERKRGRHAKEERTDSRGTSEAERRASPEESAAYNRERILKKIERLGCGARKARVEEIAAVVTELRQELKCSVDFILEVINSNPELPHITRSAYYYTIRKQDKDHKNDDLMNRIIRIYYNNHERYGYRRITLELVNEGLVVNHKKVKRLMTRMGLLGVTPKAKYKSYKGDMNGTVKNLLLNKVVDEENHVTRYERDFSTDTVNQKWTTDVSEFHIPAGKLYLSPILDMYNGEIVSYNISRSPNFNQVTDMLAKAFAKYRDLKGLIFQSDQGWQYQMEAYHQILKEHGIIQSMSRKGNCLDNCVMENFFGKMKNEMFYGHEFEFITLEQLEAAMNEYIEYYNNKRIQVRLKGMTPCQARLHALRSSC